MATGAEVLNYLLPNGGWVLRGNDYEGIEFVECDPITKEQFEAGFATYDAWKAEQDAAAKAQKQAILDRLGLTEDELRIVIG
jgi:hypothetical protein